MKSAIITLHIEDAVHEISYDADYIVDYTVHEASRGKREAGTGLPLEPDEPRTIEVESIRYIKDEDSATQATVTGEQLEEIYQKLYRHEEILS